MCNESEKLKHEWSRNVKLVRDPGVVPLVGKLMREWSVDELPQLLNIVMGTMGLVGPGPFRKIT
jgi:lipopolysaccharide/colanic/teichoic acid biosynthesis glycosyltransferase